MDIFLLLLLILLNGVLAMSEIAVVSSRKSRLQKLADDGSPGAKSALELSNEPSGFLSTVQVGITTVGILSGAIGENALADPLTNWLSGYSLLEPYARGFSLTLVVIGLTYFSVVVGELVPKRLGLLVPLAIAVPLVAGALGLWWSFAWSVSGDLSVSPGALVVLLLVAAYLLAVAVSAVVRKGSKRTKDGAAA